MGDALAICLMELKGFNTDDFAKFHPGGTLGKKLYLRVADLYIKNEKPKLAKDRSLKEVIVEISSKRLGATAVVDSDNNLLGIITDGDLRRMLEKSISLNGITAMDIMTTSPKTIGPEQLAVDALDIMRKKSITQLAVIENGKYLGFIHLHDLIREGLILKDMSSKHNYVAIMAGGIGSRFWPMSRTAFPKQFLDILNTGKTLIQHTYDRYKKLVPEENIFIITSSEYIPIVKKQLPHVADENILGEPSRKNTAPCVAYVSFKLLKKDPNANLVVAPADHLVTETSEFIKTSKKALDFVNHINAFVTLGIKPTHPNTGYGYIQHDTAAAAPDIFKVKTFTEKPNEDLAKNFYCKW